MNVSHIRDLHYRFRKTMQDIFLLTGSWLIADGSSTILKRSFIHAPEGLIFIGIAMLFIVEQGILLGRETKTSQNS